MKELYKVIREDHLEGREEKDNFNKKQTNIPLGYTLDNLTGNSRKHKLSVRSKRIINGGSAGSEFSKKEKRVGLTRLSTL